MTTFRITTPGGDAVEFDTTDMERVCETFELTIDPPYLRDATELGGGPRRLVVDKPADRMTMRIVFRGSFEVIRDQIALTVRMEKSMHKKLQEAAHDEDRSVVSLVRRIVAMYLRERG